MAHMAASLSFFTKKSFLLKEYVADVLFVVNKTYTDLKIEESVAINIYCCS